MCVEYQQDYTCPADQMFYDWALHHKTIIICNGGNQKELHELFDLLFCNENNPFPYTCFNEDEQSLNKCLTCVGVVLPERIYEAMAEIRRGNARLEEDDEGEFWLDSATGRLTTDVYTPWEVQLINKLNQYRLA
jgi:hypothetical protein